MKYMMILQKDKNDIKWECDSPLLFWGIGNRNTFKDCVENLIQNLIKNELRTKRISMDFICV